ncbi:MAG TPA: alpha/beta hydrolase [Candidatus Rifleibacterium sp.]|nr:alpha/beta hydrolase [Candidatus Rifleibacterium sp.]HPT44592.1 alpha/beta hydrolase [Candidatus Rifleibacterium sp.]
MRRKLRKILIIAGMLVTAVVAVIAHTVSLMIVRPNLCSPGRLSDAGNVAFKALTDDGIEIHAIHYPGAAEAGTILLCHGHGANMTNMNDMIAFLRKAGYGLLLLDFRAHGLSGGEYTTIGQIEWRDIKAVLNAAREKGFITENTPLAAYGRSMGAATLINGAENLPEIKAFILESSFEKLRKIAARDAWNFMYIPDTFLIDVAFAVVRQITGIDYFNNAPEEKTRGISNRAVYLIHDEKDARATRVAFDSLKSRLPQAQTWEVKDAWHVCAHHRAPVEFEMRFLNFLYQAGVPGRP